MGNQKRKLTPQELQAHLDEHIDFMHRSCVAFDEGIEGEAKRLATSIRVLVNDTRNQKSLLKQLHKKNIDFFETSFDFISNPMAHSGLVYFAMSMVERKARYAAMLDKIPIHCFKKVPFDDWWNQIVFRDNNQNEFTRRDIILYVSDQDGGAHVDPALDEIYASLLKDNTLGMHVNFGKGEELIPGSPVYAAVRQIAHEILKTLISGYIKTPEEKSEMIMGGMGITKDPTFIMKEYKDDDLCPCESGLTYIECHGKTPDTMHTVK